MKPAGPGLGSDVGVGQLGKEAAPPCRCSSCGITLMTPTRPPWPRPLLSPHLSSQFPNPNRILPHLRPLVRKQEGGAGLGNPHYLCPNWVSRFLFTLLSAVGVATASGKKEKNLLQSAQPADCSAPKTSQETRMNAHTELPWHKASACEKCSGFPPRFPREEGRQQTQWSGSWLCLQSSYTEVMASSVG